VQFQQWWMLLQPVVVEVMVDMGEGMGSLQQFDRLVRDGKIRSLEEIYLLSLPIKTSKISFELV
jgi:hypothetical protein